ncbi:uncharacterized protein PADG_11826 [Paracoccidioides brasiliensis Pb18]|uniref:Uncharacterized protein n=1 Tax=Paracoccidioides brasiliensis (strain Pb18) TaxID=502780 RepID=A0A0A0HX91_PARBD|nr:uncharacterized protein PADG_11826 [Paracoccidioides brasiliensis Pb18]KGM92035.1 hypothetical protein PADG_11826 [Paracoccidioides brasiliensis Pb18]
MERMELSAVLECSFHPVVTVPPFRSLGYSGHLLGHGSIVLPPKISCVIENGWCPWVSGTILSAQTKRDKCMRPQSVTPLQFFWVVGESSTSAWTTEIPTGRGRAWPRIFFIPMDPLVLLAHPRSRIDGPFALEELGDRIASFSELNTLGDFSKLTTEYLFSLRLWGQRVESLAKAKNNQFNHGGFALRSSIEGHWMGE